MLSTSLIESDELGICQQIYADLFKSIYTDLRKSVANVIVRL